MPLDLTRRDFSKWIASGAFAASSISAADRPVRKLKIGHTGITWNKNSEQAIKDISDLGYAGFETFGEVLEEWDEHGGLRTVLDAHNLPLISAYCTFNMIDPAKRKDELDKMRRWGALIKKNGGNVSVLGPNGVPRSTYDFNSNKANIVASLNECGRMLTDMGLTPALHQHTGTCIETRDEVYAILDAVDTRYVKFGPDIGQLQKGGSDPVQVVKDYLPLVRHMHLKDYDGGPHFAGYCPLGQGKVNIPAVLDMVENANMKGMVMVELDSSRNMPFTPAETARLSKSYLQKLGYNFRT
jgi:inosose dehydratase